jgi:hypothetical protein
MGCCDSVPRLLALDLSTCLAEDTPRSTGIEGSGLCFAFLQESAARLFYFKSSECKRVLYVQCALD